MRFLESELSNVIQFPVPTAGDESTREPDRTGGEEPRRSSRFGSATRYFETNLTGYAPTTADQIPIEALYPSHEVVNPTLGTALRLIDEAMESLAVGLAELRDGNDVSADNQVMQVQALLPELFCCRTLGDGFGSLIVSIFHALKNNAGAPLTIPQVEALRTVFYHLRSAPFLGPEESADVSVKLIEVGLDPSPAALAFLVDFVGE